MMNMTKIVILIIVLVTSCNNVSGWISDYDYRMPIEINNTGSILTNYQYNFTVNTTLLVSTGKMNANGSDCCIADSSDVLQEFWNETAYNSSNTKIWVKATYLGNVTNTTHYMYYGKPEASSLVNGNETFEFFDDFLSTDTLNTIKTTKVNTYLSTDYVMDHNIIKLHDGTWFLVFREGTAHIFSDSSIKFITSSDNGSTWSAATIIYNTSAKDDRTPNVIEYNESGTWTILVVWTLCSGNPVDDNDESILMVTSTDGGGNWSGTTTISSGNNLRASNNPIIMANNSILIPLVVYVDGDKRCKCAISDNYGANWTIYNITDHDNTGKYNEISIVEHDDGKLIGLMRDQSGGGYYYAVNSTDYGVSWNTPYVTSIAAALDRPHIIKLQNGYLALSYAYTNDDYRIILSKDNGTTWDIDGYTSIYYESAANSNNGYPASIEYDSNKLYTVFEYEASASDSDLYGNFINVTTKKWDVSGTISVSNSKVSLNQDDKILGKTAYGYDHAVHSHTIVDEQDVGFLGLTELIGSENNSLEIINSDHATLGNPDNFDLFTSISSKTGTQRNIDTDGVVDFRTAYRTYEIRRLDGSAKFYVDDNLLDTETESTYLPTVDLKPRMRVWDSSQASTLTCDWVFVRKYIATEPITSLNTEEVYINYIPPNPTSLSNTTGNFWVNYTWSPGSGNVTDSYNVSYNSTWDNSSSNTYRNESVGAHGYLDIIVYAYNNSGSGMLSSSSLTDNVTIPNNAITITNTSDWSDNEGQNVYVDYDYTDADSDTPTFSCNRTDLFTDFSTSTGIGNWQTDYTDAGVYYVNFGVADGYSSTSNYTMNITVADFSAIGIPTNLQNTTGNFWVNYTWSAGSNTDTFNVSLNSTWFNGSAQLWANNSTTAHGSIEIVVYGYNSTNNQLSSSITDNVTIPNNAITISGVSASYTINEGETLSIDANYTDADSDTPTFNDNSTSWNVDSSTGIVSWVTVDGDDGTYSWYINVTDGYESVDSQAFTVTVNDSIEPVYFTNVSGVYHFWNYTNIPELYTSINNNSVLSHNATEDIYTMHFPFYQNNSGDTFNFNESVHIKSNNDGSPAYFRWAGRVEFDNHTIVGWDTISNTTAPYADSTRAYLYTDSGSGNITNGNMSYLGCNSATKYGIVLNYFTGNTVTNNTMIDNYHGMTLSGTDNLNVDYNTLSGSYIGIFASGSNYTVFDNNEVFDNQLSGINAAFFSSNNNFTNNTIYNNSNGILVDVGSSNDYLYGNYLYDNADNGIKITSTGCTIDNNNIYSNGDNGIETYGNNAVISGNTVYSNGMYGINIISSTGVNLINNLVNNDLGSYYDYNIASSSTGTIVTDVVKNSDTYRVDTTSDPVTFNNGVDYDITVTETTVIQDNPTAVRESVNVSVMSGTIGQMDVSSLIPSTGYNLKYANGTLIESQTSDGSGEATFTSDLTTGNYTITLTYSPTITLVSFSPTPLNTNYTGATTISYMVNSSEPLNLSSLAFLHGVNYTITGDMHNYISVPYNDISNGYYKAPNRNVTPYLSWEFNDTINGGNVWQWGGGDNDSSWITKTSINATHTWINVTRMVPQSLSNAYFIHDEAIYNAPMTGFEINRQQGLILKGWDLDQIRNRNNNYFVNLFFDTSLESTLPAYPVEIGYCNDSYNPAVDDIDTCPNCTKFLEWNGTRWINHSWIPSTNASYASPLVINAQYFTDPSPDDIAYVWLRSYAISSKSYVLNATDYDPGLTNITFAETQSMWTYNEQNGVTTPAAYTPSYFAMYTRDDEDFLHHLYIANDQGVWGHSDIFSESIGVSSVPVPPVSFEYFCLSLDTVCVNDTDMDATYDNGTLKFNIHAPADPDGGPVDHNITLHYANNQTLAGIINNTLTTTGKEYVDISFDTTPYYSSTDYYTMRCESVDDEGSIATQWLISNFTLDADGNQGWITNGAVNFWGFNDISSLYTTISNNSLISYNAGEDIYTMHIPFFKSKYNDTFAFNETVHLKSLNNEDVTYFRFIGETIFDNASIHAWNTTSSSLAPITDTYRGYVYSSLMSSGNITNSNLSYLGSDFYRQEGLNFVGTTTAYTINNTTFSHNAEGPIMENCASFTISNSTISNNVNVGVGVYFTNNTITENNTMTSNGGRGVSIYEGHNNIIRYNTIIDSGIYGIHLWSNSINNTCTGNNITGSTIYDYYLSSSSTDNYIIDPASSTDKIRVTSTSSLNIENTDNAAFSEDSLNTSYAHLTNFSMYVSGTSQTFDITQHTAIITPSTDTLTIWNLEWDDTLTFNASSDTALNPTWFNITNASWASSIVNVSINGTLTTTENTDANGLMTYNYTDPYSEKWFEFQLYSSIPTPTPTTTATPLPSGGSSSGTGTTIVGTSDEPLYNIDCRETGKIRNLQAGTETYYRTTKPDCTDIIKVTFTPNQNSPEQSILIEKLHNISRFVTTTAPGITYSNFNLYVGLFGFDEKTTNEKILFKVSKDWASSNNVTPESVTLYIFDPSTTSWKSLPTTLSHTDTLYYVYESESGATYGRFAIVGTDKVSQNIIEILTEKIENIIPSINISESKFITGATSLYNNLKEYIINLLPTSISFDTIYNIFDNENASTYIMAILTIILIATISYFYNYEHGLIAVLIAIILMIIVTILQDIALIKIMSVEAGNIIISTVAYTTLALIISYILGEKLK